MRWQSGQNSLGRENMAALKAVCVLGAKGKSYPLILLLLPFFLEKFTLLLIIIVQQALH